MGNLAQFALVTLTSVLFIVDPIAVIPTYLVITQAQTSAQRAKTAQRACVAAALILVAFALFGTLIFEIFGITIENVGGSETPTMPIVLSGAAS